MSSHDGWLLTKDVLIPEFLVQICCFGSSLTSVYIKNFTVPYVQKTSRWATAHLSRLHQTLCWLSLSEVATAATV